ncbi:MAG TPA: transcriptional regulator [Microscillaceae bacterium]|nr:transcriptional regulator [Microscillaceae bacterium]
MDKKLSACANPDCGKQLLAVRDAIEVLGGKWRIPIITVLGYYKTRRFKELQTEITGITAKMLSKELKELEANQLVTRTVQDTRPITVIYEITPYGYSSSKIIRELYDWGVAHREKVMK